MKKVNWGIIGLGNIANKFADGFKNSENAKLVGISSRNINKLKKFKEEFKIKENYCFDDYKNLLKFNKNLPKITKFNKKNTIFLVIFIYPKKPS